MQFYTEISPSILLTGVSREVNDIPQEDEKPIFRDLLLQSLSFALSLELFQRFTTTEHRGQHCLPHHWQPGSAISDNSHQLHLPFPGHNDFIRSSLTWCWLVCTARVTHWWNHTVATCTFLAPEECSMHLFLFFCVPPDKILGKILLIYICLLI